MENELLYRLPPHDASAERGVLGSIMLLPTCLDEVSQLLTADDFYVDAHQLLYSHFGEMRDSGTGMDAVTIFSRITTLGHAQRIGGSAYLAELLHAVPHAENAVYYAKIVAGHARRRRAIHAAQSMLAAAWDMSLSVDDVISACEIELQHIPTGEHTGEPVPFNCALLEACNEVDAISNRKRTAGLTIGLANFDLHAGGLFPGELTILASRPSVGKTSLGLQAARHAAMNGHHVYFASLEMRSTELALRVLCADSGVAMSRVRSASIGPADLTDMVKATSALSQLPIVLHDRAGMTVADVRRACRKMAGKRGLDLVIVDYLQRVTPADRSAGRHLQVGQITWDLKALALELRVPVLCLCQLSRGAEEIDKNTKTIIEPRMSHLKESGDIEQDADMVLLLHRQQRAAEAKLLLVKNRQGEQASFNLSWDGKATRFSCSFTSASFAPEDY